MQAEEAFLAVANEDIDKLLSALNTGIDVNATRNSMGRTLLGQAAYIGNEAIAQLLIEHGADVNASESSGNWNILVTAAITDQQKIVRVLLDAGASVTNRTSQAELRSSLSLRGQPAIVCMLCEYGATYLEPMRQEAFSASPLFPAIASGDVDQVKELAASGEDVDGANAHNFTPLKFAANFGNAAVGEALLQAGARVDGKPTPDVSPPLVTAASAGHLEFVELLIRNGAEVNAAQESEFLEDSFTALDILNINPHRWLEPVRQCLIDHGAVVRSPDEEKATEGIDSPAVRLQDESATSLDGPTSAPSAAAQNIEPLIFTAFPAGFFFRYGLILQAQGNDLGIVISVAAFFVGAFFVFPLRPFWQPLIAVAVGIGVADLVQLL